MLGLRSNVCFSLKCKYCIWFRLRSNVCFNLEWIIVRLNFVFNMCFDFGMQVLQN
jgi:hypothetical protein